MLNLPTPSQRLKLNNKALIVVNTVERGSETPEQMMDLKNYTGFGGTGIKGYHCKEAIFTQYYSPKLLVDATWTSIDNSGLKYKNVLEPAVGAGAFINGCKNKDSKFDIVDIDKNNIEVTQRLNPNQINYSHTESFETFEKEGYELVLSNFPMVSKDFPRQYAHTIKPNYPTLHHFYLAHSVEKLNENGVLFAITSTSTLDGTGEAKLLREETIKECDFLGGYRLSNESFIESHTKVMTDIIIIQKRPQKYNDDYENLVSEEQKIKNKQFVNTVKYEGITVNEFIIENKEETLLGDFKIDTDPTKYGNLGIIITGKSEYEKINFKINDYKIENTLNAKIALSIDDFIFEDFEDCKNQFKDSSDIYFKDNEKTNTIEITENKVILYSDSYKYTKVNGSCVLGREDTSRVALKTAHLSKLLRISDDIQNGKHYDIFTVNEFISTYMRTFKIHPLNDKGLSNYLQNNNSIGLYYSFIYLFDINNNPSPVFTKKVRHLNNELSEIDKIATYENADGIIDLVKNNIEQPTLSKIISSKKYYYIANTIIQNKLNYFSGDISQKIKDISQKIKSMQDTEVSKLIKDSIPDLKSKLPKKYSFNEISFNGNEDWIKNDDNLLKMFNNIGLKYIRGKFLIEASSLISSNLNNEEQIIYINHLNKKQIIIRNTNELAESFIERFNDANLNLTNIILPKIRTILETEKISLTITKLSNGKFNRIVEPDYQDISIFSLPKTFKNNPLKLELHQENNIKKNIFNKKGLIGFEPGGGKTITAVISLRELQLRGLIKKTLVVVPANTITQWKSTIKDLYPECSMNDSSKDKKLDILYDITNNNYDFVVISNELFSEIKLSVKDISILSDNFIKDIYESGKLAVDLDEEGKSYNEKEKQKIRRYLEMFKTDMINMSKMSDAPTLDKLGFDSIIVDEIHNFKNIGYSSDISKYNLSDPIAFTEKSKNISGDVIDVSIQGFKNYDMKFKLEYLSSKTDGNYVFLLSGTPTPKKPIEIYTILKFIDKDLLKKYGINNVQEFIQTFFKIEKLPKKTQSGIPRLDYFITSLTNTTLLRKLINRFIDFKTFSQMNISDRPQKEVINHIMKESVVNTLTMKDTKDRLIRLSTMTKSELKDDEDSIITVFSDGRYATVSNKFYNPKVSLLTIEELKTIKETKLTAECCKIEKTIELVCNQRKCKESSGQIIFIDRQLYIDDNLQERNIHTYIKESLVKSGVFSKEEIGICNSKITTNSQTGLEVKKTIINLENLMTSFNKGLVKVIIGTTHSLGVGVDLNKLTTDIYNIDLPTKLNAGDLEQRLNRGVRQGNINHSVRVHNFTLPFSYDELLNNIISKKRGFNDSLWVLPIIDNKVKVEINENIPDMYDILIELEQDVFKKKTYQIENRYLKSNNEISELNKIILKNNLEINVKSQSIYKREITIDISNKELKNIKSGLHPKNVELDNLSLKCKNKNISDLEKSKLTKKYDLLSPKVKSAVAKDIKKLETKIDKSLLEIENFKKNILSYEKNISKNGKLVEDKNLWRLDISSNFWNDTTNRIDYNLVKNYYKIEDLEKEFVNKNLSNVIYKSTDTNESNIKPKYLQNIDSLGCFSEFKKLKPRPKRRMLMRRPKKAS
jgi:hypothetical protein